LAGLTRTRLTRKSAVDLKLQPGRRVYALIKSIAVEAQWSPRRGAQGRLKLSGAD
jgi:hypothetical protein